VALSPPAQVADYLAQHQVMTLATQGLAGPWAAAVFYAELGQDLVFLSTPTSRHGANLALDPRCAATIQSDAADWRHIRGIQLEGLVAELAGDECAQARSRYEEKFPFTRTMGAPAAILKALARVRWYRLRMQRLYFIDNERGFGQRQVFEG
jgi:uncharacterized protein YhbP (UPF0306 family)